MKKSIIDLEKELKKKTGEAELPVEEVIKKKNTFDSSKFIKLAKEVKKILFEDEQHSNSTFKTI